MSILYDKTVRFVACSAGGLVLATLGSTLAYAQTATTEPGTECLLDTNANDAPDSSDTVGGSSGSAQGAIACGFNAQASGVRSLAIGADGLDSEGPDNTVGASAAGTDSIAIGSDAVATKLGDTAIGQGASATGQGSTAVGNFANAGGFYSVAVGFDAETTQQDALAFGNETRAHGLRSVAIGGGTPADTGAYAAATESIAIGSRSVSQAAYAIAIGGDGNGDNLGTRALAANSIAFGADATVNGNATDAVALGSGATVFFGATSALAIGKSATAESVRATAIGENSVARGSDAFALGNNTFARSVNSLAIGGSARATVERSTAIGSASQASGVRSLAIGDVAQARAENATAIGYATLASQVGSTALGANAQSAYSNATAIGANAATTAANQVTLGGAGSSVRIGDIDASTAAQNDGQLYAVTVDSAGTLGKGAAVATQAALSSVESSMRYIAAVSDAQFAALSSDVTALGGRVDALEFQLSDLDQSMRGGIAAAAALGSAIAMPGKRFTIGGNVATHGGEQGYAASFTGRVSESFAIGAGIAGNSGDDRVTAQVGFALGF